MLGAGFQTGMKFFNGRNIEALVFVSDKLCILRSEDSDTERPLTLQQLESDLENELLTPSIVRSERLELKEYQQKHISRYLPYLKTLRRLFEEQGLRPTAKSTFPILIIEVEKAFPETRVSEHPKCTSISRHWKRWVTNSFDDNAISCAKRKPVERIHPASEAFLKEHVMDTFLQGTSSYQLGYYKDYSIEAKKEASQNPAIQVVSERTYRRRLAYLREYEKRLKNPNLSEQERNKLELSYREKIKTDYALERVECDRVEICMSLIDDITHTPTDSLSLYIAFDVYTRFPISVIIETNEAENKENGVNLLRNLFMGDENLTAKGKPIRLVMDNGPGFNNRAVKNVCQRTKTSVIHLPIAESKSLL